MFRFVILLAFVAGVLGAAVTKDEEVPQVEGRIFGGTPAIISSFPYLVSVQVDGNHRCGGVIITPNKILTTAQCVLNIGLNRLRIRAGSSYWNQLGVPMGIADVIVNRYNPNTRENNLAVLRLTDSLRLSNNIRTIPLAGSDPPNGSAARIPGWGATESTQTPEHITFANVRIIGRAQCADSYGSRIKSDMFCAAAPGVGPCSGDDGGPLVVNNILVGIASWGFGCALPNYPAVYVSVAAQRNWIDYAIRWV